MKRQNKDSVNSTPQLTEQQKKVIDKSKKDEL